MAAGEGFEPSLTDPESLSIRSRLLLSVSRNGLSKPFCLIECFRMFSEVSGGLVY